MYGAATLCMMVRSLDYVNTDAVREQALRSFLDVLEPARVLLNRFTLEELNELELTKPMRVVYFCARVWLLGDIPFVLQKPDESLSLEASENRRLIADAVVDGWVAQTENVRVGVADWKKRGYIRGRV